MEHEVFVPVPAERLREALADPVRVARAVPGLQQDAGAEPVTGRLKVRVGGHTITYRGSARLSAHDDGSYAVEGDATEARGTGAVKLALTLRVREAEGGSALTFDGTATADGRVTELPADAVSSAVTRLLNRFAEALGVAAGESGRKAGNGDFEAGRDAEDAAVPADEPEAPGADASETAAPGADASEAAAPEPLEAEPLEAEPTTPEPVTPAPTTPEPPDYTRTPDLPAEAAHARRTMIGRSAEEVDHAPPRGRYAPVPAPQTVAPHSALRWAAPAAALVVASAIVVGRVLRKRR
ncbi:SRPBCC domain-containing protein [Streptomyces sp. NPDC046909]|uniref:SRPBCC domain-containing protein n=1 Tax=Streptomyces sp. NPDC046909 TaxID=3155617 RepID=UPI0033FBA730